MSIDDNKRVIQKMFEAINANDLEAAMATVADDAVVHTPIPGVPPGREGFRGFVGLYLAAFPEQRIEVHELVGEGDRVLVRHTHHVKHGGEFAGMAPTGREAVVHGLELFRLADGKVAEMWHHDDLLGLMQQLGAIGHGSGA
jgi:steroid delta-isomerase-like uncharacterized protein